MAAVQYVAADTFNLTAVSATTPLPVTNSPGASNIPLSATSVSASSGNVANASAAATIPAVAAKTNYITGFQITAGGATAAAVVSVTVTGLLGGTATFTFGVPAGAGVPATPLVITFPNPLPASAVNTAIVVTCPALGAGNTNATVTAQGYVL